MASSLYTESEFLQETGKCWLKISGKYMKVLQRPASQGRKYFLQDYMQHIAFSKYEIENNENEVRFH